MFSFSYKVDSSDNKTKVEMYNLRNIECQKKFREFSSRTKMLSSVFDSKEDINILAKRFIQKLDGCIKSKGELIFSSVEQVKLIHVV